MERYFKGCSIENLGLKGKTAIVTEGNNILGKTYALALAKAGANLIIHTNDTKWDQIRILIEKENHEVIFVQGDLSNKKDRDTIINLAMKVYGKIDILINNIEITMNQPLFICDNKYNNKVIQKNLATTYFLNKEIGDMMKEQNYGKIVNSMSISSIRSEDEFYYENSKYHLEKMTRKFAQELASSNVQVNCIDKIEKESNPIDIARTIVFLASKLSDYINGKIVSFNRQYMPQE